ncbi:MAG: sigma-70 family RNA polymerase sigma factor [Deltaproteobacteria bacterium]|nr:MAG: sigma-70 family RNA polymerase sigma factor [Deltaproteobacteria bacterium]
MSENRSAATLLPEAEMIRLVRRAVRSTRHVVPHQLDDAELLQIGVVECLEAMERFEPERGVPLSAYLWPRVRGGIMDRAWRTVGWTRSQLRHARRAAEQESAESAHGEDTSPYGRMSNAASRTEVCIERISADGMETELPGMAVNGLGGSPERILTRRSQRRALRSALESLSSDERTVMRGIYQEQRPLSEIGKDIDRSRYGTCRLHRRVIERLRNHPDLDWDPDNDLSESGELFPLRAEKQREIDPQPVR